MGVKETDTAVFWGPGQTHYIKKGPAVTIRSFKMILKTCEESGSHLSKSILDQKVSQNVSSTTSDATSHLEYMVQNQTHTYWVY